MIRPLASRDLVVREPNPTPEERARVREENDRYRRNLRRYERLAAEIGRHHVGKFICIAGEELFVGDDPIEVRSQACAAHPEDAGSLFFKFVSLHRGPKVYANQWRIGAR